MHLTLYPARRDDRLVAERHGDTLVLNGEAFDFSGLADGQTLPCDAVTCDWLTCDVKRIDGVLHLSLVLPHGPNAPQETLFPEPITVLADGSVNLPAWGGEP